jgi:molybdate transport system substrate-binding protein
MITRSRTTAFGCLLALAATIGVACDSQPARSSTSARPVVIFAASSLKEVISEIAATWSGRSGRPHQLQFEATSTLARQILEGAPADVFITAAPEWLDKVSTTNRFDWLSNRLVLVVPAHAPDVNLKSLTSLALANEQVPVGKYAREALAHQGINVPDRTIYGQNVRDVLSKVSQGGAQAGVVYATDVAVDPNVRAVFTFPPESHSKILYSVGLITPDGLLFFEALRESWALELATKRGFVGLD